MIDYKADENDLIYFEKKLEKAKKYGGKVLKRAKAQYDMACEVAQIYKQQRRLYNETHTRD